MSQRGDTSPSPIRPGTAHELLHKVVMAVISHNHAPDLYDFPDVLAYFDAQLPNDPAAYGPATKDLFAPYTDDEQLTQEYRDIIGKPD